MSTPSGPKNYYSDPKNRYEFFKERSKDWERFIVKDEKRLKCIEEKIELKRQKLDRNEQVLDHIEELLFRFDLLITDLENLKQPTSKMSQSECIKMYRDLIEELQQHKEYINEKYVQPKTLKEMMIVVTNLFIEYSEICDNARRIGIIPVNPNKPPPKEEQESESEAYYNTSDSDSYYE